MIWKKLCCASELNLLKTLKNGQSFRWKQAKDGTYFTSIGSETLFIIGYDEKQSFVRYRYVGSQFSQEEIDSYIRAYFHLEIPITQLYKDFSERDCVFAKATSDGQFDGIRLLRIDPSENLISFLTSQNNNIKRISQLIETLCLTFGKYVGSAPNSSDDKESETIQVYSFPEIESLIGKESLLRELGFGYRAKYIDRAAFQLSERARDKNLPSIAAYLAMVRDTMTYSEAKQELLSLMGIGPKVADCICLFSLDKFESIPVDTHVKSIACKSYGYKFGSLSKTITPKDYANIQQLFQERFGKYCGWAHSILFTADLSDFSVTKSTKRKRADENNDANSL
jgi:N-glycosylase/DNA lyase